jgi:hypothetical protein
LVIGDTETPDVYVTWSDMASADYSRCMADYYLVRLARGAEWNCSLPRREQVGWIGKPLSVGAAALSQVRVRAGICSGIG